MRNSSTSDAARVTTDPGHRGVPHDQMSRRLRWLFAVLCAHGVLFAISDYSAPDSAKHGLRELYETFAFLPLQLGSVAALLVASGRQQLMPGTRRALRWVAYGFGALAAGSVAAIVTALVTGARLPYVSWADLLYYQLYPALILGMMALPTSRRTGSRARLVLDTSIVVTAFGALIVFAMVFEATTTVGTTFDRVMVAAYSAGQLITLLVINRAVERANRTPSRSALYWLFVALALSVVGDLVFQLMYSTGYRGPNWSRAEAIAANLAMIWAGIRFHDDAVPETRANTAPLIPFSPLPIIAVTSVAMMVMWLWRNDSVRGLEPLIVGILVLNFVLVARDMIAARDAALVIREDANRTAEQRLEALVKHSTDAILLTDASGRLLFASAPATDLFGMEADKLVGQMLARWVDEEDAPAFGAYVAGLRTTALAPATHTWRLRRPDGTTRAVESVGLDLLNEPAVGGLVFNSRDVTERIALEDRLRQAQKLEVVGHLAGGVAHDFNNVLTAIVGGAELAQLSLPTSHEAQYDLEQIRAAAERGAALTRRLLAFVRLQPVPSQSVRVEEMLADIEPLLRRLCGDPIALRVEVHEGSGTVHVDRDELEHIIFNLVANARDAMPNGGPITVVAMPVERDTPVRGDVIDAPAGRYVSISVRDAGTGMDDDARRRMFDPFFSSKSGGRGTGLGLIGVRPLIEAAGGGLSVDSRPGDGTRVELLLPLIATDARARAVPVMQAARDPLAACILLIEDELAVRESLGRLLVSRGATVHGVGSAAEARAALGANLGIDCVLCDVMMPGETGLEFRQWLKTEHASLPVLMMSGHTGAPLDRVARETGDVALIRKPFTGDELAERLRQAMGAVR